MNLLGNPSAAEPQPKLGIFLAKAPRRKEPRYAMESASRKQSVQPSAGVGGLSNKYDDEYSPVPWEAVLAYQPSDR